MRRLIALIVLALVPAAGFSTPIQETPWMPTAAAYRLTLFMGNLEPVPWDKITRSWTEPVAGASLDIRPISQLEADQGQAMVTALASQDRQTVFQAATGAVFDGIQRSLDAAEAALGTAQAEISLRSAQELYRAFEDGIKAADVRGYRSNGLAWLEMNSAVGSQGVLGSGELSADAARFAAGTAGRAKTLSLRTCLATCK